MEPQKYDTFGQRLDYMLRESSIGKSELADLLGVHRSTVHWWVNDKNTPKGKMMRRVEEVFNLFNPIWIQYGRGQMYKDSTIPSADQVEQLLAKIRDKEQVIELLYDKIRFLEEKQTTK